MMKSKVRNGYIGMAAAVAFLALAMIFFNGNEDLMQASGLATFAIGLGVFLFLDEREYRARRAAPRDRS